MKSLYMQQSFLTDEETEFKLFAQGHVVNKLISYMTMDVLPLTSAWWWWWLSQFELGLIYLQPKACCLIYLHSLLLPSLIFSSLRKSLKSSGFSLAFLKISLYLGFSKVH